MSLNIEKLRSGSSLQKVKEELAKVNTKQEKEDDNRYWKLKVDKASNGAALIRFLPAPEGDEVPWVRLFSHAFQGPGGWYIENSLTTLNQQDPVSEYNRELWNTGLQANQEIVRKQKRKLNFIANILVIKDPAAPENEGKVFLFRFGKKIFDKIQEQIDPPKDPLQQKEPFNPFCPFTGANLMLRSRKVDGYPNYDASQFEAPSPLFGGDEAKILELHAQEHPLAELVGPAQFKSYDDLKRRLDRVLGLSVKKQAGVTTTHSVAETSKSLNKTAAETSDDEDDIDLENVSSSDDLDYLSKLAEGD